MNLREIWNELLSMYTRNHDHIHELWLEIENAHKASWRAYHNLSHVEYMMNHAVKYNTKLLDPDIVRFSIFYHDIVYNINRQDNEEKSSNIAQERMKEIGVPANKIIKCQDQILATKSHKIKEDNDTNFLLDFDLAILGDYPENYKDYKKRIRKEYSIYPDFLYNKGRRKVLQHFLDMERIYKTEEFHACYELPARKNLISELEDL